MNYRCPLCREPLQRSEQRWHCAQRHSFDIAKQGYTNLLPVQHKKSKSPGDDAQMVAARRAFLDKGFYQPLSDHINRAITQYLRSINPTDKVQIVDAGCGEGYYSNRLHQTLNSEGIPSTMTGIDISKFAVLSAAKRNKDIQWFVANSSKLPIEDRSVDCILSLFSPLPAQEFHRCLKDDGLLVTASTGSEHLIELRNLLYDEVRDTVFDPGSALSPTFSSFELETNAVDSKYQKDIRYNFELKDSETIKQLFSMTPHYWRVSPQRKKVLDILDKLSLTLDIQLRLFTPGRHTDTNSND